MMIFVVCVLLVAGRTQSLRRVLRKAVRVVIGATVLAVLLLLLWLAQFKVANESGYYDGGESKQFLETGQTQNERQEQQQFQLEQLQNDEQRNEEFLQFVFFCGN